MFAYAKRSSGSGGKKSSRSKGQSLPGAPKEKEGKKKVRPHSLSTIPKRSPPEKEKEEKAAFAEKVKKSAATEANGAGPSVAAKPSAPMTAVTAPAAAAKAAFPSVQKKRKEPEPAAKEPTLQKKSKDSSTSKERKKSGDLEREKENSGEKKKKKKERKEKSQAAAVGVPPVGSDDTDELEERKPPARRSSDEMEIAEEDESIEIDIGDGGFEEKREKKEKKKKAVSPLVKRLRQEDEQEATTSQPAPPLADPTAPRKEKEKIPSQQPSPKKQKKEAEKEEKSPKSSLIDGAPEVIPVPANLATAGNPAELNTAAGDGDADGGAGGSGSGTPTADKDTSVPSPPAVANDPQGTPTPPMPEPSQVKKAAGRSEVDKTSSKKSEDKDIKGTTEKKLDSATKEQCADFEPVKEVVEEVDDSKKDENEVKSAERKKKTEESLSPSAAAEVPLVEQQRPKEVAAPAVTEPVAMSSPGDVITVGSLDIMISRPTLPAAAKTGSKEAAKGLEAGGSGSGSDALPSSSSDKAPQQGVVAEQSAQASQPPVLPRIKLTMMGHAAQPQPQQAAQQANIAPPTVGHVGKYPVITSGAPPTRDSGSKTGLTMQQAQPQAQAVPRAAQRIPPPSLPQNPSLPPGAIPVAALGMSTANAHPQLTAQLAVQLAAQAAQRAANQNTVKSGQRLDTLPLLVSRPINSRVAVPIPSTAAPAPSAPAAPVSIPAAPAPAAAAGAYPHQQPQQQEPPVYITYASVELERDQVYTRFGVFLFDLRTSQWVHAAVVRMPNDKSLSRDQRKQQALFYKFPDFQPVYLGIPGGPIETIWRDSLQFASWIKKQITSPEDVAALGMRWINNDTISPTLVEFIRSQNYKNRIELSRIEPTAAEIAAAVGVQPRPAGGVVEPSHIRQAVANFNAGSGNLPISPAMLASAIGAAAAPSPFTGDDVDAANVLAQLAAAAPAAAAEQDQMQQIHQEVNWEGLQLRPTAAALAMEVGTDVEIRWLDQDCGMRGAWYSAKIIEKAANPQVAAPYFGFYRIECATLSVDGKHPEREWMPIACPAPWNSSELLVQIRLPDKHGNNNRGTMNNRGRPRRAAAAVANSSFQELAEDPDYAPRDRNRDARNNTSSSVTVFEIGERVEASWMEGWWMGYVSAVSGLKIEKRIIEVTFDDPPFGEGGPAMKIPLKMVRKGHSQENSWYGMLEEGSPAPVAAEKTAAEQQAAIALDKRLNDLSKQLEKVNALERELKKKVQEAILQQAERESEKKEPAQATGGNFQAPRNNNAETQQPTFLQQFTSAGTNFAWATLPRPAAVPSKATAATAASPAAAAASLAPQAPVAGPSAPVAVTTTVDRLIGPAQGLAQQLANGDLNNTLSQSAVPSPAAVSPQQEQPPVAAAQSLPAVLPTIAQQPQPRLGSLHSAELYPNGITNNTTSASGINIGTVAQPLARSPPQNLHPQITPLRVQVETLPRFPPPPPAGGVGWKNLNS